MDRPVEVGGRGRRRAVTDRRGRPEGYRPDRASQVGELLELEVGPVGNGGVCIARHEGRVVFVRHALPGERIRARVTAGGRTDRYLRADAVEVLAPSTDRVTPPCRYAGPGGCGGCDWQHATLAAQRRLKATVLAEQFRRLAGLEPAPVVEAVPGPADGAGWRTRMRFAVDSAGRAGLRRHRSHEVVALEGCHIAAPGILATGVLTDRHRPGVEVEVVASGGGEQLVIGADAAAGSVHETVAGRRYAVPAGAFWQVHPAAATTLVAAVLAALEPRPGDTVLDLYAGAGLFAGALGAAVAPAGSVLAVESDPAAAAAAVANLADLAGVQVVHGSVDRTLGAGRAGGDGSAVAADADLVVLDPPRAGAGRAVCEQIARLGPRRIAYVSCDPATLARDVATFAGSGYRLTDLRAWDLFPHTHHLEALAVLAPLSAVS